jgi:hypothetical protein
MRMKYSLFLTSLKSIPNRPGRGVALHALKNPELRSLLTHREGELDSRLRDRDRTIEELNLRLRELAGALRKKHATRELLSRQSAELKSLRVSSRRPRNLAKL